MRILLCAKTCTYILRRSFCFEKFGWMSLRAAHFEQNSSYTFAKLVLQSHANRTGFGL